MRIYRVEEVDGWEQTFWPTRKQAMDRAGTVAVQTGKPVEIEEIETLPMTSGVLCHILNGYGGYVASEQLFRRVWPVEAANEEASDV